MTEVGPKKELLSILGEGEATHSSMNSEGICFRSIECKELIYNMLKFRYLRKVVYELVAFCDSCDIEMELN